MTRPTWGDTVRIKSNAPSEMRPGQLSAVCGMRDVENSDQAKQFGCADRVYLVEFGDGHSIEVPEHFVEVANE